LRLQVAHYQQRNQSNTVNNQDVYCECDIRALVRGRDLASTTQVDMLRRTPLQRRKRGAVGGPITPTVRQPLNENNERTWP